MANKKKKVDTHINFKELKKEAYRLMMDDKLSFWLPFGFIMIISFALGELSTAVAAKFPTCIYSYLDQCLLSQGEIIARPFSLALTIFTTFLSYGLSRIILAVVRRENHSFNDVFYFKKDFFKLFLVNVIITLLTNIGYSFLIVPGIIIALSYSFVGFVNADKNLSISSLLKESRKLIKGYKWNYLLFNLSFVGWIILGAMSFGLLYIFILPYMMYAEALYYERLKAIKE